MAVNEQIIYTNQHNLHLVVPPVITYAVPFFLLFIGLEWFLILRKQKHYPYKTTLASIGVGIGTLAVDFVMKSVIFAGILLLSSLTPLRLGFAWYTWVCCFIVIDFATYWGHRIGHSFRFFWASHVPHHSPEVYNLSVGIRLSWLQHLKIFVFAPIPLLGFDPFMVLFCYQVTVVYQFWIHTELIGKLGILEWVFVTPSNHRVHHAVNPKYLDKNFGAVLIIWDRLFGTYVPETEQPVYGITKPMRSYDPFKITFHEFADLFHDVRNAKTWKQKWKHLFNNPSWKP